ncbi:MAG TPA: hypothetical protein VFN89_12305 [Solirubrobacterales bacterium]|nr:hypothetical protein [Solirubrobacterales bacterium]
MIDRLRFLLDRPLDPLAARAVVVFASAILLGFAALFVLGASESGPSAATGGGRSVSPRSQPARPLAVAPPKAAPAAPRTVRRRRQDPQDEQGSVAAKRAATALRTHRALQHVPYRRGRLTVRLVGAQGARAVLAVSAPTIAAARRGWQAFLRRYRDDGRSYLPRFQARGGHRG